MRSTWKIPTIKEKIEGDHIDKDFKRWEEVMGKYKTTTNQAYISPAKHS